jgi:penicillin-binding protein 2
MKRFIWLVVIATLLSACELEFTGAPPDPPAVSPTPLIEISSLPDPANTARAYLDSWKEAEYPSMYSLLTPVSQDAISSEEFSQRYTLFATEGAVVFGGEKSPIEYTILSALTTPPSAQIAYRVRIDSVIVGEIHRDTMMHLRFEAGEWRIQWEDTLILPELANGNRLKMETRTPSRGNIYDRNSRALVAQGSAVAVGINTLQSDPAMDEQLLAILEEISLGQVQAVRIQPKLDQYRSSGWYLPIGDFSTETILPFEETLQSIPGVILKPFRSRYYFDGGTVSAAPHITGYMSVIPAEQMEHYLGLGYQRDERVGRAGIEFWGEAFLAGTRGGSLYVVDSNGQTVTKLAEAPVIPAQSIYTTLDKDLQSEAQKALSGLRGAIVVLERDSGRVLAMASSPGFNPNLFEPSNFNSEVLLSTLYDQETPLLNRAAQGLYPLGSVFKIITMAAAMDSGRFSANTEYPCGYLFQEIPGVTLNDWTYEHYLADGRTPSSGTLTLSRGLAKSCNPYFWHIGLSFFNQGLNTLISDMAAAFGLGRKTGLEIAEEAGRVPVPQSQIDATNLAIGQGDTLVSPLQVANFVAAVGNGGILYKTSLIERIAPPDGEATYVFTPTVSAELPLSAAHLNEIQLAMVDVIGVQGTARSVGTYLTSYNIPAAGKTGTAQSGQRMPHAWFAGYTFAEREDKPDIAVAVVIENGGEGSLMAAPVFQGMVKYYFYGAPRNTFPWEVSPGVLISPPEEDPGGELIPTPEP